MRMYRLSWILLCGAVLAAGSLPVHVLAQEQEGATQVRSGVYHGRVVNYAVVNGRAILGGDVVLQEKDLEAMDQTDEANRAKQAAQADKLREQASGQANGAGDIVSVAYPAFLWPKVGGVFQVPYIITTSGNNLSTALTAFNNTFTGFLQFVPRNGETDYVNFNFNPLDPSGQCEVTSVGRGGGQQFVEGSVDCSVGTVLHEMGHTIGLYHEMVRSDRDTYVSVMYNNIIKGSRLNFDPPPDNTENLTLYDYGSIMHYIPFAFTRNGGPAIESIPAGIPLSNNTGYTTTDIDGIKRLYGMIPSQVTIDSNPTGLQVMVDGTPMTTPQVFSWSLNSTHTLSVGSNAQTLNGTTYIYGRWNDNAAASHSITVTPGNNMPGLPATAPQVTVYTANFSELVGFNPLITPAGSGSFTKSPAPMTVTGAAGLFYVVRQQVTFTATPTAGNNFYEWFSYMPGAVSSNPKTVFMESMPTSIDVAAGFTPDAVTTINTNPPDNGTGVIVDGQSWLTPKNFSTFYDSAWTAGSSHSLDAITGQEPYSINTRYEFANWSDGGAESHSINVPAGNSVFTATMTPQYVPIAFQTCGGSVALSPTSPDGFYNSGTPVTFTETPVTGWTLTGWQYDLTGVTNPQTLTVNDEELAQANFNVDSTPFSATSLTPPNAVAGSAGFTLTVNGTGFASNSLVNINGLFRFGTTFVNSTTLTVPITATDIATPGAFQVSVENFPVGSTGCAVFAPQTFFVLISGKTATTTGLTSSVNPSSFNQAVTFTATVTPSGSGSPTGTVTFTDGATTLSTVNLNLSEQAAFTTSTLTVKTHAISATYNGDPNFSVSTSPTVQQVVSKAATTSTVTSSVNPSSFNQSVTFTATVTSSTSGVPTGTVQFKDGSTRLATVTLNGSGKAILARANLTPGTHSITVVYAGSANFLGSTSTALIQTVNKASTSTTVTSSKNPSTFGQRVTFTATITPAFGGKTTGTVTFKDGSITLGSGNVNTSNKAAFSTATLSKGTHSITAVYNGNVDFTGSTSAVLTQTVN